MLSVLEETFKYGDYVPIEVTLRLANAVWTDSLPFPVVQSLKFAHSSFPSQLHSYLPVMASWVTKKVILDFLFLLHMENSTMEFPTMVKTKRTHRVINCSVCEKQSNRKQVYREDKGTLQHASFRLRGWNVSLPASHLHLPRLCFQETKDTWSSFTPIAVEIDAT